MTPEPLRLPDDPDADPGGMLSTVLDTPAQWQQAITLAQDLPPGAVVREPRNVVVAGMGGSGITGQIAAAVAYDRGRVPVVAVNGYRLPAWVGPGTLTIAVSHSGNTEETLAAAGQAVASGAELLVVTSGGRLAALADRVGAPVVTVPGHLAPRASLAYLTTPVLVAMERCGVLPGVERDLDELPGSLAGLRDHWRPGEGEDGHDHPVAVAARLIDTTPWFLGAHGLGSVVAYRAVCQLNENAGRIAHASQLPEADHNTVVAWAAERATTSRRSVLVELRDLDEPPAIQRRFTATREVVGDQFTEVVCLRMDGPNPLARLAAGVLFVDLVSVALALLTGVDPTPVEPIARLKHQLAGDGGHATPSLDPSGG